ncbi:hypothetical protein BGY98DRAFT_660204 [Russula aff. rugulosa BPL654]|nr:hypothetical protein BGY98DRAFT_660204 [Russula aff. rugulosa BPL654]
MPGWNAQLARLTYGKWSPGLRMSAAGSQGLSELKQSIMNSEQSVTFAFCRISVDGIDCFATITYIPEAHPACEEVSSFASTPLFCTFNSWALAARTSMAARTVQSWFKVRPIPALDSPIATYSNSVLSDHKQS